MLRQSPESSRREWLTPVLSQHRAYRSVHGAFNSWRAQTDRLWLNHKSHCLSISLLSLPGWPPRYASQTSILCDYSPPDMPNPSALPSLSDFLPSFLVSSIVSIYTYGFCDIAIHSGHLSYSSYLQAHNNSATHACILLSSVRQTRGLPMGLYVPHIQLPSDSTSRWTPLPSAISFPLPGGFGTLTR